MLQWFNNLSQEVQLAFVGLVGTIAGGILGMWRESRKPPERSNPPMTLAGALIDGAKADELMRVIDAGAIATTHLTEAVRSNTIVGAKLHDEVGELRDDLREVKDRLTALHTELQIQREMGRRQSEKQNRHFGPDS